MDFDGFDGFDSVNKIKDFTLIYSNYLTVTV